VITADARLAGSARAGALWLPHGKPNSAAPASLLPKQALRAGASDALADPSLRARGDVARG
jgi:hypothetical protein